MACVWIRLCTEPFPGGGVEKEEGLTCLLPMPLFLFPISQSVSTERSTHMFEFHYWAPSPGHSAKSRNGGGARSSGWEAAWPGSIIKAMKEVLQEWNWSASPRLWKPEGPSSIGSTPGKAHHGGSRSWCHQGNLRRHPRYVLYNYQKNILIFLIVKVRAQIDNIQQKYS